MKTIFLFACVIFAVAAVHGKSTRTPRFMWMPDGDGRLHLVDLNETEPMRAINPQQDISLLLYTKNNPTTSQRIQIEQDSLPSVLKTNAKTRFVIHGWNSSAKKMDGFRAAYLAESGDYNVILVDWSGLASALYTSAKSSSKEVGVYVGEVITYLVAHGVNVNNIQLAGHSLGAHAAGVAGNRVGSVLTMITGMDPAAPLFGSEALADRLDESDAQFVQVIHTCAGLLGWEDPMGDADFYPNGGKSIQPGCGLDVGGACSHGRSHEYFIESITSSVGFRGHVCSSWNNYNNGNCNSNAVALMGEHISNSARGSYYLKTASSSPYAQG